MSIETVIEENTAALREFTAYMKLALDAASKASETTLPVIEKPMVAPWEIELAAQNKATDKSRDAMRAELAEARDRVAGPLVQKPKQKTLTILDELFDAEQALVFAKAKEAPLPVIEPAVETKKPVAEAPPKVTAVVLPATETASALTLADISLGINAAAKIDRARVVTVLASFGVKSGGNLKPEQFADFLDALK